jgi:hypothetical protein
VLGWHQCRGANAGAVIGNDEANQAMNGINIINDSDHRSYFAHPNDPVYIQILTPEIVLRRIGAKGNLKNKPAYKNLAIADVI